MNTTNPPADRVRADGGPAPCWKELLGAALEGLTWGEHSLEGLLDRLERTR